ncbi:MAG: polysaccharide biosynthesis tyrosine autokinase [Bacteroidales bacterium]|nr:polysaccharide biosynthesis tyrosine autokinase [Bacteroidales bacterium]
MEQNTNTNNPMNSQDEYIDLGEIFFKYFYYRKWFLISILSFLFIGYIYLETLEDNFKSKASILIINQSNSGSMSALNQLDQIGFSTQSLSNSVQNEVEIIQSQPIAIQVVNSLNLYTTYYKKEFLEKKIELYNESPIEVKLSTADLNNMKSDIKLSLTPTNNKTYLIKGKFKKQEFEKIIQNFPAIVQTPVGNILFFLKPGKKVLDEALYVEISNPVNCANKLLKTINAELGDNSDAINLTTTANNKQKVKDILNTLIAAYNQDALTQINLSAYNTANFITGRLKLLTGELSDVERKVENYKQTNKLTDISSEAQLYLTNNNTYEQKRMEVETQLNLINYVEDFTANPINKYALIPNLGFSDEGLLSIIQDYNKLILERELSAKSSSDENPRLKDLSIKLLIAKKGIINSIKNSKKGLLIAQHDLKMQDALMISRIKEVPRQEREFIEIKRQQQIKESLYIFLLQKREEAELTMAITAPKSRILKPSSEIDQIAPKKSSILLIFFLLGLILPILILYIRDRFTTTLKGTAEVEKLTTVPVISELGHNDTPDIKLNHLSHNSTSAELFRLLRTKVQLALDYPKEKVILITSSVPGEGKTFVSINLSISLSLTEKKVLLIGLDLRKPRIAEIFNFKAPNGLTAYLSGMENNYSSLITTSSEYPYLDLLPAGAIPPNPSELIQRKRLDDLIEDAKTKYDYIILDTAPVGAVADSLPLNRLTSLNIYVFRANYSHNQNIHLLNRIQHEKSLTPLYLLMNDVNQFAENSYYGTKYHFGGYGYEEVNEKVKPKIKIVRLLKQLFRK